MINENSLLSSSNFFVFFLCLVRLQVSVFWYPSCTPTPIEVSLVWNLHQLLTFGGVLNFSALNSRSLYHHLPYEFLDNVVFGMPYALFQEYREIIPYPNTDYSISAISKRNFGTKSYLNYMYRFRISGLPKRNFSVPWKSDMAEYTVALFQRWWIWVESRKKRL